MENREPVSIRVGQTLSVLSGTNVSIDCSVSGVPKPEITWSRDGRVLVKESLLIIDNVTSEDTGVYLCKAFNLEGEVAASSMVNVTGKLYFISLSRQVFLREISNSAGLV